MFPIRDNIEPNQRPLVVWTLIALNLAVYMFDRMGNLFGPSVLFTDLAVKPISIVEALQGNGSSLELVTLFTSLFLHANLGHLIGNLIFLWVFGEAVEATLGSWRLTIYYIFWGIFASAAHIYVLPTSAVPMLGASGAIGGVLGCYFLCYPGNPIKFIIFPFVFYPFIVEAWILLGIWFVAQIVLPQAGVANWAHVGGFLGGMLTVLIMGGPEKVRQMADLRQLDPLTLEN